MFRFSEQQLRQLAQMEARYFVERVRDEMAAADPQLMQPALLAQLNQAYDDAQVLGFQDQQALVRFLYMAALAPGFYKEPVVARWLRKPGRSFERRLDDLLAAINTKTELGGNE